MSFLQLVFSLDKTFEKIILFWRICQVLTDITTIEISPRGTTEETAGDDQCN